ncbi:MAG: HAD family hydrolase [Deltaproteobacteria bacterium]|nr:HAD family hydrolase [Deltaproteobacteria bacterium]
MGSGTTVAGRPAGPPFRALILDFDGTLVDSRRSIVESMEAVLAHLGLPPVPGDQIAALIGLPLEGVFARLSKGEPETIAAMLAHYRSIFQRYSRAHSRLFPGVRETLEALQTRGIPMAIATSKSRPGLEEQLDWMGLRSFFTAWVTNTDVTEKKPHPEMAHRALAALGAVPETTLVVGDTTYDLHMGRGAGCATAGVVYGNHSREELAALAPDYLLEHFGQVAELPWQ